MADQKTEVENLQTALHKLDQKLAEAEAKSDLLIAQHRRARALSRAERRRHGRRRPREAATFDRMKTKVQPRRSHSASRNPECSRDNMDEKLAALDKEDQIEKLLGELKSRQESRLN